MKSWALYFGLFAMHFSMASADVDPQEIAQRIDQLVLTGLYEEEIEPNPPITDAVFLRRIYLDVIGRIPTYQEALSFFQSSASSRRADLINDLLGSEGYISHASNYWADLLRIRTRLDGSNYGIAFGVAYRDWIETAIRENMPYDRMVFQLVSATGKPWENGAAGFYMRDRGMQLDNLALTIQVFLGTQIVCAQCHDHPYDDWTQKDYYELAAFTYGKRSGSLYPAYETFPESANRQDLSPDEIASIRRSLRTAMLPLTRTRVWEDNRPLRLPQDYAYPNGAPNAQVDPKVPFGRDPLLPMGLDPAIGLAQWISSPETPRFVTVIANRMWKRFMGHGLIEPIDALDEESLASNPTVLAYLEDLLHQLHFDLQAFQRILLLTDTYLRAMTPKEIPLASSYAFPGPVMERMTAEQIWDSLMGLILDDVDAPNPIAQLNRKKQLLRTQWLDGSIGALSAADFVEIGRQLAQMDQSLAIESERARAMLEEGRETQDLQKIQAAHARQKTIEDKRVRYRENLFYRKGLERKVSLAQNQDLVTEQLHSLLETDPDALKRGKGNYIQSLVNLALREEESEVQAMLKQRREQEKREWEVVGPKKTQRYEHFWNLRKQYMRASDLPSPASPGHFLADFGQSDRTLIENGSREVSVTQALQLLNGFVLEGIFHPYSKLSRNLQEEVSSERRLEVLFLSILTRLPTKEERQMMLPILQSRGLAGAQDVAWILLNTSEFLFIQ